MQRRRRLCRGRGDDLDDARSGWVLPTMLLQPPPSRKLVRRTWRCKRPMPWA
uniref:Predicted protein n=1 Tax=Hordeum vulgare subsp. vulgare TaxID=112509 RepID=F2EKF6_HORVV|nr:predicted protein [Hordeum vulgare subsp. vulgare]